MGQPNGDRYSIELEIISVEMDIGNNNEAFPIIELLKTNIVYHATNQRIECLKCETVVHICYDYGIKANTDWKRALGYEWQQTAEWRPYLVRLTEGSYML